MILILLALLAATIGVNTFIAGTSCTPHSLGLFRFIAFLAGLIIPVGIIRMLSQPLRSRAAHALFWMPEFIERWLSEE
jgi:hypothetical protein